MLGNLRIFLVVLALAVLNAAACSNSQSKEVEAKGTSTFTPRPMSTATFMPSPTLIPSATPTPTLREVLQAIRPSVVRIETKDSVGTGFVAFQPGQVLTAFHVIGGTLVRPTVVAADGSKHEGILLGADEERDLALLVVPTLKVTPLGFASESETEVGDSVLAIGYAAGISGDASVTRGIISGKRALPNSGLELLQTDAPLNPGNSGGPLLNERGQVIGVNVLRLRGIDAQYEAMGFAIPSEEIRRVSDGLSAGTVRLLPTSTPRPLPTVKPVATPTTTPVPVPTPRAKQQPQSERTVMIVVLWNEQPVPGVRVYFDDGRTLYTAADGSVVFENPTPGEHGFSITFADGSGVMNVRVQVAPLGETSKVHYWIKSNLKHISPPNEAETSSTPTFVWQSYPDAYEYEVTVRPHVPCAVTCYGSPVVSVRVPGTSYNVGTPLQVGVKYAWFVLALNKAGHPIADDDRSQGISFNVVK